MSPKNKVLIGILIFMITALITVFLPGVFVNLISNLLYDLLKIVVKDWVKLLFFQIIMSSFLSGQFRRYKNDIKQHPNNSEAIGENKKHILMQGSMFSLWVILSYLCQNVCGGVNSNLLALPFQNPLFALLSAVIPLIQSSVSYQGLSDITAELAKVNNVVFEYIDKEFRRSRRVDERMIKDEIRKRKVISEDQLRQWARMQLFLYFHQERYKRVTDESVMLDTFRDADNWKILKGHLRPAYIEPI